MKRKGNGAMSNPVNPGQHDDTNKQRRGNRRPVKWTYLELTGLALASFLILWPVVTLVKDLVAPSTTALAASPTITKSVSPANPAAGSDVTYVITVKGGTTGGSITISDVLPSQVSLISATNNPAVGTITIQNGNTVLWDVELTANQSVTLTIIANVLTSVSNSTVVKNTAIINQTLPSGPQIPSNEVSFTVTGAVIPTATNSPVVTATNTPVITATNTPVITATKTPVITATSTPIVTATSTATKTPVPIPTNTPVPAPAPTNTPSSGGGSDPVPTNTNRPSFPTDPSQITVNPATITAVLRTLTPGTAAVGGNLTPPATSASASTSTSTSTSVPTGTISSNLSGVVSGSFTSSAGGLNGSQVSLIRRSNGSSDETIKTATIDSNNEFFFSSVSATGAGQVYFVRFSNPDPGSGVLRLFNTNPFSFAGGNYRVPTADLSDVRLGPPGTNNTAFQAPLTLDWFSRSSEDRYSVTVFRANGNGPALDSGNLAAGSTSYTITSGQLGEGSYFAQINVLNPLGAGISNRQFAFRLVPGIITQPTATRPVALPTVVVLTNTPVRATVAQATATTVIAQQQAINPTSTTVPTTPSTALPNGGQSLPASGGELPIFGLLLAGFTLITRRIRLVRENR
jgi:hypothetical protein